MCFRDRLFLITLCSLKISFSHGQFHLDPNAKNKFDSVFLKLPGKQRHQLESDDDVKSYKTGLSLFSQYVSDTLNKKVDSTKYVEVQLEEKDRATGKWKKVRAAENEGEEQPVLFCVGHLQKDSLIIQIAGLFPDEVIFNVIAKNFATTYYASQLKDYVYKIEPKDSLSKSLFIPATISSFNISDTSFEVGKLIYGNAKIKTATFYKKDGWYDDKFDKIQMSFTYYFSFKVEAQSSAD
jgi:hypothetical protein